MQKAQFGEGAGGEGIMAGGGGPRGLDWCPRVELGVCTGVGRLERRRLGESRFAHDEFGNEFGLGRAEVVLIKHHISQMPCSHKQFFLWFRTRSTAFSSFSSFLVRLYFHIFNLRYSRHKDTQESIIIFLQTQVYIN